MHTLFQNCTKMGYDHMETSLDYLYPHDPVIKQ